MKKCTKCGKLKPLAEFYNASKNNDGLRYECKTCASEMQKKRQKANPAIIKDQNNLYLYGMNYLDVLFMLKGQNYICPVCYLPVTEKDHLDHDHVTDKNRAYLHQQCNMMLGQADDKPERLMAGIIHLWKHQPLQDYQI